MAAVNEVLQEAGGKVRIEDVLPLFPDFVTIDAFKAAICASLEDYNSQIERLKGDMADATRIADALRWPPAPDPPSLSDPVLHGPCLCQVPASAANLLRHRVEVEGSFRPPIKETDITYYRLRAHSVQTGHWKWPRTWGMG